MTDAAVGVLLPLRIETRFRGSVLRVLAVPDTDAWFDRHDPLLRAAEVTALAEYAGAAGTDPRTPTARAAWRTLVGRVGGGRAVWMVRTHTVLAVDGSRTVVPPAELREGTHFPQLPFFPRRLQVWLARGGATPAAAVTFRDVDPTRLRVDLDDPAVVDGGRWFTSWTEAESAGLAGEVDLGVTPGDVDVLYVVGLGDADGEVAELFTRHQRAGRMSLLAPGTPTNTVDAAPAADNGADPQRWLDALLGQRSPTVGQVSAALTGVPGLLGDLPPDDGQHRDRSQALVAALWPALWGFAQRDVWEVPHAAATASWAVEALCPEGPFPILRLGGQPFGLLPATSLDRWRAAATDPAGEAELVVRLRMLLRTWANAAERRGTTVGADTDRVLDHLALVPTSPGYRHRPAQPLQLWFLALLFLGYPVDWSKVMKELTGAFPLTTTLDLAPRRFYVSSGGSEALRLPLMVPASSDPAAVAAALRALVVAVRQDPPLAGRRDRIEQDVLGGAGASLVVRLLVRSVQLAVGDVGHQKILGWLPLLPQIGRQVADRTPLETRIVLVTAPDLAAGTPAAEACRRVLDAVLVLADLVGQDAPRLEGALRATIDTSTHRIDPWVAAAATRRLRAATAAASTGQGWRLGAYGWVDRPRPGTPGPNAGGLIHAPSATQATAAMVLRDRAIHDPEPRWHLNLTSRTVRTAERFAAAVRAGTHLSEVVGAEVERAVGDGVLVERLRRDFGSKAGHSGRRVCDGLAVLAADRTGTALGLSQAVRDRFGELRAGLDAYGDLLVAQAVHDVVDGRAETAGAVLDAAAGLARPPDLSVLRSVRGGRAVSTTCVLVLPAPAGPALPADPTGRSELSPGEIAEPAFAAFLTAQLGAAPAWTWTTEAGGTVTLAELGLTPVDTLALSATDLGRVLGEHAGSPVVAGAPGSERHARAARLAALVGRRPATTNQAIDPDADRVGAASGEAELLERWTTARTAASALIARLRSPSPTEQAAGLRSALRWGIAPSPDGAGDAAADPPAARAADMLADRLAAAPADLSTQPADEVAAHLVELVSASGVLGVLGRLPRTALPPDLTPEPGLDPEWLTVVATVREPLARLEAHQLAAPTPAGAGPALVPWSNRPGDPWQAAAPDQRLIAAYAPAPLDLATTPQVEAVAVAVLDRFAETVPAPEQATSAVFGFDAPSARAPNAILLAVPPDPTVALDVATTVAIVAETRLLAHARMARPADLDELRLLLPTGLLPAGGGATDVPLDPPTP